MASVKKRPDGRYRARYRDASGREHAKHFRRKTDAQTWLDDETAKLVTGTWVAPKTARTTVGDWCDSWLAGYGTRRESTVRQARTHVAQIRREFGDMQLAAVRPSHVKAWCARLRADGVAPSYVYALHARLAQLFTDAVHDGIVPRSPCSRRTSPGQGKQRPYVATTEQVWALHDAMPKRYRAAVLLGAFVGLRVAEACGLRVGDVDFMRKVVHPAVQYPAELLKTETSRTAVPIPETLALDLAAHVKQWPAETVLSNEVGEPVGPWALERVFRKARAAVHAAAEEAREAGEDAPDVPVGFRFHDLRHYLASLLIASGADVKTVQARLRHASAKTTLDTYGHLWPDRDESTRAAIEAVLVARETQDRPTTRPAGPADNLRTKEVID
jgi:integrase